MPEMKTLNGYEVVDAKAREDIKELQNAGYATETYVDNAIDNIPEVDLSKHALKSELPTKVSQLQNDSKFITREEVPETDLSAYAKKSEIPDVSDFITSIPSEYITESELNAKGYLTQHQDISGKADKEHTHSGYATWKALNDVDQAHYDALDDYALKSSIPTKVSQLANDSNYLTSIPSTYITEAELEAKNYLTEHQSLAAYATKTYVDNTVAENQPNLSGYAKKSDIPDVSDFISEIPSEYVTDGELAAKKYATESYVGEAIAQAQLGGEDVDLSAYAKKTDVPTKTSQLTNDSNFLTSIPAEYITETELNNKGYLTEHQSLDGYATEKYVDDAIAGIEIPEVEIPKEVCEIVVPSNLGVITDTASIQVLERLYADERLLIFVRQSNMKDASQAVDYDVTGTYIFIKFLDSSITSPTIVEYLFERTGESTWKVSSNETIKLATNTYVDDAVANIDIPEVDVDTSAYNLSLPSSGSSVTDEKTIQYLESIWADKFLPCRIGGALVTYYEKSTNSNQLMLYASSSTISMSPATLMFRRLRRNAENDWTIEVKNTYNIYNYNNTNQLVNGAGFVKQADIDTSLEGYATETYVDDAIAGIELPETIPTYTITWGSATDTETQELIERLYNGMMDESYIIKRDYNLRLDVSGEIKLVEFIRPSKIEQNGGKGVSLYVFGPSLLYNTPSYSVDPGYYSYDFDWESTRWKESGTGLKYYKLYTTTYINGLVERIEDLEEGGVNPGGSGGSGKIPVYIPIQENTVSAELKEVLLDMCDCVANKTNPLEKYDVYITGLAQPFGVTQVSNAGGMSGMLILEVDFYEGTYAKIIYRTSSPDSIEIEGNFWSGSNDGGWISTDSSSYALYNATEVYVRAHQDDNSYVKHSSYVVFSEGDCLGNHTSEMFLFEGASPDNTDSYWSYDGNSISTYGNVYFDSVFYKE